MWTLKKDFELADLVTWWLKCPVLQSDPGPPPQAAAHRDLTQTDYFSLPSQAGAAEQRRASRKDTPSQMCAMSPPGREPSHTHSQARLPGRPPVCTEKPAVPASLGVFGLL